MKFLPFKGSDVRLLLPSAEESISANEAATKLVAGDELANVMVSGLDLTGLSVSKLSIRNCVLESATLANAHVEHARFERVVCSNSTWVGVVPQAIEVRGCLFTSCRFDYAYLSGLEVTAPTAFVSCSFREADLTDARLPEVIFHDCQFNGANLAGARLAGADIRASTLEDAVGVVSLQRVTLDPNQLSQLLEGVVRDLGIDIRETEAGPAMSWREVPET